MPYRQVTKTSFFLMMFNWRYPFVINKNNFVSKTSVFLRLNTIYADFYMCELFVSICYCLYSLRNCIRSKKGRQKIVSYEEYYSIAKGSMRNEIKSSMDIVAIKSSFCLSKTK